MFKNSRWNVLLTHLLLVFVMLITLQACGDNGNSESADGDVDSIADQDEEAELSDGEADEITDGDADSEQGEISEAEAEETAEEVACGSGVYEGEYLIAGPAEEAYDADLAAKARRFDRVFHALIIPGQGLSAEASVTLESTEQREMIESFANEDDTWDFTAFSGGLNPEDVITGGWFKIAGLYGGMGICADAMRYAVLRDQKADCNEIEIARQQLIGDMDKMHIAFTIPGVPGVAARGFVRKDLKGFSESVVTTPLFDDEGNPLPEQKNNGEWREDNSGLYPDYVWEDSCSRDMMLGWAAASAVIMEVIRDDASFDESLKERVRSDAAGVVRMLREVRESGYDLEFLDADGRITYHGYLNEHSTERDFYLDSFKNGFHAIMALGTVGAFVYAASDPELDSYLYDELIKERDIPKIAAEDMIYINMGSGSNWSNYSMALTSAWLAHRYIDDEYTRTKVKESIDVQLYDTPGEAFKPVEQKMSLYDFVYAASEVNYTAFNLPDGTVPQTAFANGMETLQGFHNAPYWDYQVINCDETETANPPCPCELNDGTVVTYLGLVGRGDADMCDQVIPRTVKHPDNYEWRSNPYRPNGGGDGSGLMSGVDFRIAYWLGRYTRTK